VAAVSECLNPLGSVFPGRQMKWHEACLSISAAILEILNAWENSVLTFESIQVGLAGGRRGAEQGHRHHSVSCRGAKA